jgi:hypothetical protein
MVSLVDLGLMDLQVHPVSLDQKEILDYKDCRDYLGLKDYLVQKVNQVFQDYRYVFAIACLLCESIHSVSGERVSQLIVQMKKHDLISSNTITARTTKIVPYLCFGWGM